MKAVFDRLDANHDNQLSFDEFSRGVRHLLHTLLPEGGPGWARPGGWFGGQEFGRALGRGFGQGLGPPAHFAMRDFMGNYPRPGQEAMRDRVERLLQELDVKHEGKLTKDEALLQVQRHFDRINAGQKGYITPRDPYKAFTQLRHRQDAQDSSKATGSTDDQARENPRGKEKPDKRD